MEHKEDKKRNKGGRPKKGAIGKMTYRVAVKIAEAKEHSDHVRKLCGMANNLNQLARKANAGVSLPEEVSGEVVIEYEVLDFAPDCGGGNASIIPQA